MPPQQARVAALFFAAACSLTWVAQSRQADASRERSAGSGHRAGVVDHREGLPRVRLIATGGTISVRAGVRVSADQLLDSVGSLTGLAQAEAEQFANTASASLTLEQWLGLAQRINAVFREDPALAAVVVTTGTDTLEETAYFLNLTVRDARPVVVVGAMRHGGAADFDGRDNLLDGFRVAVSPASRGQGVLVVLNGAIHSAREVAKMDATRLDAFSSPAGALGLASAGGVVYHRSVDRRHTAWSEFDVSAVEALPRVDVVLVYQGASGDVIRALADQGAEGIVIAAAGAGSTSGTQHEGIRYAAGKGVVVVTSSRMPNGRILAARRQLDALRGPEATRIPAGDLSPLKARILLMLALTMTRNSAEIQRMFEEY